MARTWTWLSGAALWAAGWSVAMGAVGGGYTTPGITDLGGGKVSYKHFTSEDTSLMHAWKGRNVVLLARDGRYPETVVSPLLYDIDKIYDYYSDMAGGDPRSHWSMDGKTTIAEVPDTGPANIDGRWSAAKGFSGSTGIEISSPYFRRIVDGHSAGGGMDNIPYWEMGRNFWYGGEHQVGWKDGLAGVGEAYALAMQFIASRQAGVVPSEGLRRGADRADQMLDAYIRDHRLGYENTLAKGKDPYGNEDSGHWLVAAMVMRLHRDHGGDAFLRRFLAEVRKSGGSNSRQQALDMFAVAASRAARRDLSRMMREEWKLPISAGADAAARNAGVITQPLGGQGLRAISGGDLSPPPSAYPYQDEVVVRIEGTAPMTMVAAGKDTLSHVAVGGGVDDWTVEGSVGNSGSTGETPSSRKRQWVLGKSVRVGTGSALLGAWLCTCAGLGMLTRTRNQAVDREA